MNNNKVYISGYEANFTALHFLTKPFKFIIKWYLVLIEKTFPYHHISDNYHYKKCGSLINHVIGKGGESINHKKSLKHRNSNVFAYELTCDIDIKKWHKDSLYLRGKSYDALGALFSEAHEYKLFSFMNVKPDDQKFFCDGAVVWKLQNQGYLKEVKNRKEISTSELIELLIKNKLCNPIPLHVWDGKKIINNIFEEC